MEFWDEYLYRPVFNGLIWMYNNWTEQSLGWAVVYLTLLLRLVLLPFTIIDERNKVRNEALYDEIRDAEKGYKGDAVLMKEEVRKILRKRKVQPWAKAMVLGLQAVMLLLLYQVFTGGTTGERVAKMLYPSVNHPATINTIFYGFDIAEARDYLWSGVVAIWLAMEIYFGIKRRKTDPNGGDLAYFILFPLAVFLALWFLPMVKALFVLTSMIFSAIVHRFIRMVFRPKKKPEEEPAKA